AGGPELFRIHILVFHEGVAYVLIDILPVIAHTAVAHLDRDDGQDVIRDVFAPQPNPRESVISEMLITLARELFYVRVIDLVRVLDKALKGIGHRRLMALEERGRLALRPAVQALITNTGRLGRPFTHLARPESRLEHVRHELAGQLERSSVAGQRVPAAECAHG